MNIKWLAILWFSFVCIAAYATDFQTVTMELPKGNAKAGKTAFVELQCHTCHKLPESEDIKSPLLPDRGPDLGGKQANYTAGHLATAILAPSHVVPPEWTRSGGKSPMPDYSRVLTVREFIDILEFISTLGKHD